MKTNLLKSVVLALGISALVPVVKADDLPKPDFTVTARDIYAEFRPSIEKKDPSVKQKYTGKIVRITGVIKSNSSSLGGHEVELVANDATGAAFCGISSKASPAVSKVEVGKEITLQCTSTGWMVGPSFKDCVLVQ